MVIVHCIYDTCICDLTMLHVTMTVQFTHTIPKPCETDIEACVL